MKALVRNNSGSLKFVELLMPKLTDKNDVLLRITYTSLCRDDMRVDDKSDVLSQPGILGHEAIGVIEELGEYAKMKGFSVGDAVMVLPWIFCGKCHHCLSQKPQYCEELRFHQGVCCQYLVSNASQLLKIPEGLTYKQAVMIEPVGCVIEAISSLDINFQTRLAIIGQGFIGSVFTKLLKSRGVKEITVVEPLEERRKQAIEFGADHAIDPNSPDFKYDFSACCAHEGYDLIIETSSDVDMLNASLSYLSKGGVLNVFTYYGHKERISIPLCGMYYSNITIRWSSLCSIHSMEIAADIINRLSLDELIQEEFAFEDSKQAFDTYEKKECYKVGIRF